MAVDLEKEQERRRRYREAHRDGERERNRAYREANPDKVREKDRRYRESGRKKPSSGPPPTREWLRQQAHGREIEEWFARQWDLQGGMCYLCGDPFDLTHPNGVHIDHDHSCCPPRRSCSYCRRGLACGRCNMAAGQALDDPERLLAIAVNFAAAFSATRERIALKPVQAELQVAAAD